MHCEITPLWAQKHAPENRSPRSSSRIALERAPAALIAPGRNRAPNVSPMSAQIPRLAQLRRRASLLVRSGAARHFAPDSGQSPQMRSITSVLERLRCSRSARSPRQHPEEALDVGIGADIPIPVEVGRAAGGAAVAAEAGEERVDVGVCACVAVAVEVGGVEDDPQAGQSVATQPSDMPL